MTNERNTTLYTGVTSNLIKRVFQHKNNIPKGSFTSQYKINKLAYFEETNDIKIAIHQEKQIKAGSRKKKIKLIESINREWRDLSKMFGL